MGLSFSRDEVRPVDPNVRSMLSCAAAARRLGITPRHVRNLAISGQIAFTLTALGRLFDPADVESCRAKRDAR
jgi:hypothetical protein